MRHLKGSGASHISLNNLWGLLSDSHKQLLSGVSYLILHGEDDEKGFCVLQCMQTNGGPNALSGGSVKGLLIPLVVRAYRAHCLAKQS